MKISHWYMSKGELTSLERCNWCPFGSILAPDRMACEKCPKGTFQNTTIKCEKCRRGYYADKEGSTNCQPCVYGTTDGISCNICPIGTFWVNAGDVWLNETFCRNCPVGTYNYEEGSTSCVKCYGIESTDKKSCTLCPKGTFSINGTKCVNCPKGRYNTEEGSPSCYGCPYDQIANETGSTFCIQCQKGTASVNGTECVPCPPGRFEIFNSCSRCPYNTISNTSGSTSCRPCQQKGWVTNPDQTKCIRNQFVYKYMYANNESVVYDFSDISRSRGSINMLHGRGLTLSFCHAKYYRRCDEGKDGADINFQIQVLKSFHTNRSSDDWWRFERKETYNMGDRFTIEQGDDPKLGFNIVLTNGICVDNKGQTIDRPQQTVVKMKCDEDGGGLSSHFLEEDNKGSDDCQLEIEYRHRMACPQCTCHNYLDGETNGTCWTKRVGGCKFSWYEPLKQERNCSITRGCYKPPPRSSSTRDLYVAQSLTLFVLLKIVHDMVN
ncbi:uncharacterized protein [Clytia hemisphaerica]|uniref:MRH domain-containing protein n=1 Tax=Clytia hemisphaerica TaxID=252671 RepID=A0A7M5UKC5_9CNID|eukprot:TCONS_00031033-protein